jgi:hypothetical protein
MGESPDGYHSVARAMAAISDVGHISPFSFTPSGSNGEHGVDGNGTDGTRLLEGMGGDGVVAQWRGKVQNVSKSQNSLFQEGIGMKKVWIAIGIVFAAAVVVIVLAVVGFYMYVRHARPEAYQDQKMVDLLTQPPPPPPPEAPSTESWSYSGVQDKATGKIEQVACLNSEDYVKLAPPYVGGSVGTLCLRKGVKPEAYFKVDNGVILCGGGCEIRLTAEGRTPLIVNGTEGKEGETAVVVLDSYPRVASMAKKAKQMKIEVPYDRMGVQALNFAPVETMVAGW